jgi:alanine racemase
MTPVALNTVTVDLDALCGNFRAIRQQVGPGVRVMAVVKSDAYGHGLVPVAQALARTGADTFGVAEVEEGVQLRQAGIKGEIVVLLGAPLWSHEAIVEHGLSPVVFDHHTPAALADRARAMGRRVGVHLKVDTGMGRLGVMPAQVRDIVRDIQGMNGVELVGVMSHFPLADSRKVGPTLAQCRRFQAVVDQVPGLARPGVARHIANSAAILRYPETWLDMVRPGISLYGCYPARHLARPEMLPLTPVLSFRSTVIQVKEVAAGTGLSYGHTHVTRRSTRLAVLPTGYDDGYCRRLSGRAEVLIAGQRAPILGRICMNACMADITGLDEVKPGDEVVLIGRQGMAEITADEVAGWLGTINYEVLCQVGARNRRLYLKAGEE